MGVPFDRNAVYTAYAAALIRHKAKQLCRKPGFLPAEEQDLAADLTFFLLQKGDQYDPSRGASIQTFANRVIISKVKMILRDRRRVKRAGGFQARSLDGDTPEGVGGPAPLSQQLDGGDRARRGVSGVANRSKTLEQNEAVNFVLRSLPPELVQIAQLLREGTAHAVARKMGLSRRQVAVAINELRQRFQAAGLGPE